MALSIKLIPKILQTDITGYLIEMLLTITRIQ